MKIKVSFLQTKSVIPIVFKPQSTENLKSKDFVSIANQAVETSKKTKKQNTIL